MFVTRYDKWKSERIKPSGHNQTLISQFAQVQNVYAGTNRRQKELKNAIVNNLVIEGNLPLSLVEASWFHKFMKIVDPKFAMPSRKHVVYTISQAYTAKRQALRNKLSSADAVSLTIDMWSDRRMRSFMGVTAHILSPDMRPESWLLDISSFTGSHTGDKIGNHCVSLVDDFDIRPKLAYIVTDNAANMLKAFKFMSELFPDDDNETGDEVSAIMTNNEETELDESQHVETDDVVHATADNVMVELYGELDQEPLSEEMAENILSHFDGIQNLRLSCGIHSLQLVVRDGLKCAKFMSPILAKASRLSNMIHTSSTFAEQFFDVFKNTIPCSNNTRWNSTYTQLEALSKLDPSRLHMLLTEQKLEVCSLTKREMNILIEVVNTLEPAYNATLIMEADDALVSLMAPTVVSLHRKWQPMVHNAVYCSSLANALLESLQTRFKGLLDNLKPQQVPATDNPTHTVLGSGPYGDLIYPVAAALDPEFRLTWLDEWQDDWDFNVKPRVSGMSC
jgi:hypothetical protein